MPQPVGLAMNRSFDNPEHWRQRAQEMRTLADDMRDLVATATMLEIADQYDYLATRAAERLRSPKPAA
jgi:hypothetical protein